MKYDYLFIVTYGRSGSTLLQGILNSIEGVKICGENNGVLKGLLESIHQLRLAKTRYSPGSEKPTAPWYGIADTDLEAYMNALRQAFIEHVLQPEVGVQTLGFKEIRYVFQNDERFFREMDLLLELFENSAIIFNVRELEDVFASNVRAQHKIPEWQVWSLDRRIKKYFSEHTKNCFLVDYDKYTDDPATLETLFQFLDAPFDLEAVQDVLAKPHSSITKTAGD